MEQTDVNAVNSTLLAEWLDTPEAQPFHIEGGLYDHAYTLVKVPYNSDFDQVYCREESHCQNDKVYTGNFGFEGFYSKRDGKLYGFGVNGHSSLFRKLKADSSRGGLSQEEIQDKCNAELKQLIEKIVGNDRRNLTIKALFNRDKIRTLEYWRDGNDSDAAKKAREMYITGVEQPKVEYLYTYVPYTMECYGQKMQYSDMLSYIVDPAGFVAKKAVAYVAENQENILLSLLKSEVLAKEYAAILTNPTRAMSARRKITQAIKNTNAKTLKVTVKRGEAQMTVKVEAEAYRTLQCNDYLSSWTVTASQRDQFESVFGLDYYPDEIILIEYGRSILYQADELPEDKPASFKYYSTQRPVSPGTYPRCNNEPLEVVNFDVKQPVEGEAFSAWGYLIYKTPLSDAEVKNYELRPAQAS